MITSHHIVAIFLTFNHAGATFFGTFRLAGSIPQSVIRQWNRKRQWLSHLAQTNANYYEEIKREFERLWFKKSELILDGATVGPVWLSDDRIAKVVAESLHHRHEKVYRSEQPFKSWLR